MFSHRIIKRHAHLGLAVGSALLARSATAQITINFDETGNGTVQLPGGPVMPLVSLGNQTDQFDPGNGLQPLTYSIAASLAGLVPTDGDIDLVEPFNGALVPSDLIRFEQGKLLVYSDRPEPGETGPLADVGLPVKRQSNAITLLETGPEVGPNGMFGYAPAAGQPGEISAPSVYNFLSDPAVPEPTSFTLAGSGALLLLRRRRQ